MIDTTGLNKAAVLAVLFNASQPLGMGFLNPKSATELTEETATTVLEQSTASNGYIYFDYLYGRVMKVNLTQDDHFDEGLYDRDNGQGAAQAAIDKLRASQ